MTRRRHFPRIASLSGVLLCALFALFVLTACSLSSGSGNQDEGSRTENGIPTAENGEALIRYDEAAGDSLPEQIAHREGIWYVIFRGYGEEDYRLCIGEEPEALKEVYAGSTAWYLYPLSISDGRACWAEQNAGDEGQDVIRLLYYDPAAGKTECLKTLDMTEIGLVHPRVHLYGDGVYYMSSLEGTEAADGGPEEEGTKIHRIDLSDGKERVIYKKDRLGGAFALVDGRLLFEGKQDDDSCELVELDLADESARTIALPAGVRTVYDVDCEDGVFAIYYYDRREGEEKWHQNDNIGYFREGDEEVHAFYSFPDASATYVAYKDRIELHDGMIYWIYQQNITGDVVDHYSFHAYEMAEDRPLMMPRTYDFCVDGEDLYTLQWAPEGNGRGGIFREKVEKLK